MGVVVGLVVLLLVYVHNVWCVYAMVYWCMCVLYVFIVDYVLL